MNEKDKEDYGMIFSKFTEISENFSESSKKKKKSSNNKKENDKKKKIWRICINDG